MRYRSRLQPLALIGTWPMLAAQIALPQQSTERFIPIGESPGVSDAQSVIGQIVACNQGAITIETPDGARHTLTIANDTRIWLDLSRQRLTSQKGSATDCATGRHAEVMPRDNQGSAARWIKVQP